METKRSNRIALEVENLILDGTFADGERLDEVRLAERFQVSRTPLREALQRLSLSGLVELVPRRGAFVRQPGPLELVEMFEFMSELEAACARFAALRASIEAIDELRAINERCGLAVASSDHERYYDENERFHQLIYRESRNGFLEQETLRLQRRLTPFRRKQLRLRGRMEQSLEEHESIVDALSDGDADLAARELRSHVAVQEERFRSLMTSLRDESG